LPVQGSEKPRFSIERREFAKAPSVIAINFEVTGRMQGMSAKDGCVASWLDFHGEISVKDDCRGVLTADSLLKADQAHTEAGQRGGIPTHATTTEQFIHRGTQS
jgi:hypothetical protein